MKFTTLFCLTAIIAYSQNVDFDLNEIRFKGLKVSITKEEMVKAFGSGKRLEPNYECGFFSNDPGDKPYYQLVYDGFNYIGRDGKEFYLEHVSFDTKGKTMLHYKKCYLTGLTTRADFIKIFGIKAKEHFEMYPDDDSILLFSKDSDAGAMFTFKDGHLIKFQYWTPC